MVNHDSSTRDGEPTVRVADTDGVQAVVDGLDGELDTPLDRDGA